MERLLQFLPPRPQPLAIRWSISAALVGIFLLLRLGSPAEAGPYSFIFFIPPVLLSAILFDRGTGFVAIAFCVLCAAPLLDWNHHAGTHLAALTVFVLVSALVALIGEAMRIAWERQKAAQEEAEVLLRELGHRIKNEFAIASSVLLLQARAEQEPRARAALETAVARLRVLAKSHDHLRVTSGDQVTQLQGYLGEVCWNLAEALRGVRPIVVEVDADKVAERSHKATRIGLIVNELVTNAFKHAFPEDAAGRVRVVVRRDSFALTLTVEDDGIGCPATVREGLGSRLTALLVQQMGGSLRREPANPGCRVVIKIRNGTEDAVPAA
jgi:two-component sensor histidine kinase